MRPFGEAVFLLLACHRAVSVFAGGLQRRRGRRVGARHHAAGRRRPPERDRRGRGAGGDTDADAAPADGNDQPAEGRPPAVQRR